MKRLLVVGAVAIGILFGTRDARADNSELPSRVTVVARQDGTVSVKGAVSLDQLAARLRALGSRAITISATDPVMPQADGTLFVEANGPVTNLAGTLRALVPDPAGTRVSLSVNHEVPVAEMGAIDDALCEAGIKTVLIVTRADVRIATDGVANSVPSASVQSAPVAALPSPPITVRIDASGAASVDGAKVTLGALGGTLLRGAHGNTDTRVLIQGEPDTAYGDMVKTMEAVLAAGFEKVAILNDPASLKPPAGP